MYRRNIVVNIFIIIINWKSKVWFPKFQKVKSRVLNVEQRRIKFARAHTHIHTDGTDVSENSESTRTKMKQ